MTPDTAHAAFDAFMARCPLIAILRGLQPHEAADIGRALLDRGLPLIEVPLNSPQPLESIRLLRRACGERALIGAGTVTQPAQVAQVAEAGGQMIVAPNMNPDVIRAAAAAGLVALPGVATPSEAFGALEAGAHALKAFPAEQLAPAALRAWLAVLPRGTRVLPVGGIDVTNMAAYLQAGAAGFGLGGSLYKPGFDATQVATRAQALRDAWSQGRAALSQR